MRSRVDAHVLGFCNIGYACLCICVQVNVAALLKEVVVFFGVYLGRLFEDLGCAFAEQGVDDKRHD